MENSESTSTGRQKGFLPKLFKLLGFFLLLVVIIHLVFVFYVSSNKVEFKNEIINKFNENSSGTLAIGDLEVSFFKGFPNVQLSVTNVVLRDSLWKRHQKDFLKAERIYTEIKPWTLFRKKIHFSDITLKNAKINLYKSENGYSNISVFKKGDDQSRRKANTTKLDFQIKHLRFKNFEFISEDLSKSKLFHFQNSNLNVDLKFFSKGFLGKMQIGTFIKEMNFNTTKGSYAKNKVLKGDFLFWFDKSLESLYVQSENLEIGTNKLILKSRFGASADNSDFFINLYSKSIFWKKASELVSPNINSKLFKFNLEKPFEVDCYVKGDYKVRGEPKIYIRANVLNNILESHEHKITECNFTGLFINNYIIDDFYDDINTAILLKDLNGKFSGLPFKTENVKIFNLKKPKISGIVSSDFNVKNLNEVFNSKAFKFDSGIGNFQVFFEADLVNLKMVKPQIIGKVGIKDSHFEYLPKKLRFDNNSFDMEFTSDKLLVKNLRIKTQNNDITMHGYSENFLNFLYDSPEKIVLNWYINAEKFNLEDFMYILKNESAQKTKNGHNSKARKNDFFSMATQMSKSNLKVSVKEFRYKKFVGSNLTAKIRLDRNQINFNEIQIYQGNGKIYLNGSLIPSLESSFNFTTHIQNLDIKKLLYSFNNFNSKKITYRNIEGKTNLRALLKGRLRSDGSLIQKSLNGNLSFSVSQGRFVNFEPIQNVGNFLFPTRNFNNITFDNLTGDFVINNGLIKIKPMQINTSVLNFDLAGDYALTKGTDLQMDVHLRNPENDKDISDKKLLKERRNKGVTVHLQAIENNDGKIKIKIRSNNEKLDRIR